MEAKKAAGAARRRDGYRALIEKNLPIIRRNFVEDLERMKLRVHEPAEGWEVSPPTFHLTPEEVDAEEEAKKATRITLSSRGTFLRRQHRACLLGGSHPSGIQCDGEEVRIPPPG